MSNDNAQRARRCMAENGDDSEPGARLHAQAELVGCTLIELADGGYYLSSWSFGAQIPDLRGVGKLLRQIGGAR